MAHLKLAGIRKSYQSRGAPPTTILHGIDLEIADGEFIVFVGPSGCGKSTLLRAICGLDEVDSGDLYIDGTRVNEVPPAQRGLAMVFQSYALYPHMTVHENMAFALKLAGKPKAQIDSAVLKAAQALQIVPLLQRRPKELSGASASGSRSGAPSCASRLCSCSTNRCRTWTPRYGSRCASNWQSCTARSRPR